MPRSSCSVVLSLSKGIGVVEFLHRGEVCADDADELSADASLCVLADYVGGIALLDLFVPLRIALGERGFATAAAARTANCLNRPPPTG